MQVAVMNGLSRLYERKGIQATMYGSSTNPTNRQTFTDDDREISTHIKKTALFSLSRHLLCCRLKCNNFEETKEKYIDRASVITIL